MEDNVICNRGEAVIEGKKMMSLLGGVESLRYLQNVQAEVPVDTESVTR